MAPRKSSTPWPVGVHTTVRRPDTIMASEPEEEPVSVLQRFEKRLEGLVEGAFAKVFKGDTTSVDPARTKKFGLGSTTARETVQLLKRLHDGKCVIHCPDQ